MTELERAVRRIIKAGRGRCTLRMVKQAIPSCTPEALTKAIDRLRRRGVIAHNAKRDTWALALPTEVDDER